MVYSCEGLERKYLEVLLDVPHPMISTVSPMGFRDNISVLCIAFRLRIFAIELIQYKYVCMNQVGYYYYWL